MSNIKQLNENNMPHVAVINGQIKTTSLKVAEHFRKQHKNVLRDIENLEIPEEFRQLNFEPSSYINEQGKEQPCFEMTKDGFIFLVMGFTGKDAAKWKIAYINEFNRMEQALLDAKQDLSRLKKSVTQSADKLLDMISTLPYVYARTHALKTELTQLKRYIEKYELFEANDLSLQEFQFKLRNPDLAAQIEGGKLN